MGQAQSPAPRHAWWLSYVGEVQGFERRLRTGGRLRLPCNVQAVPVSGDGGGPANGLHIEAPPVPGTSARWLQDEKLVASQHSSHFPVVQRSQAGWRYVRRQRQSSANL
jgi:hypothetical protein